MKERERKQLHVIKKHSKNSLKVIVWSIPVLPMPAEQ